MDQTGPLTTTQPASTGTGAQVNLGPDPGVGAPTLETTPTVPQILGPLFNIMPGIKNFVVPSHQSACPTYTFHFALGSWWSQEVTMTSHCTLVENNRAAITAAMLVVWTLAALFIVLTA
ncbi:hypothetical protein GALL_429610 [mine drainage metagenome]|uniref:Uncharacterized protein n=1 Tax=mine drainage metagenome TaxID=410659 RepID=A0A1J5QHA6_9ZZZZ